MTGGFDVLQAGAWYPPHNMGGTEVYLTGLVAGLSDLGVRSGVVVPRAKGAPDAYDHEGVPVMTYPPLAQDAEDSLAGFEALLRAHPARIYHQHSWTPDCGIAHLRAARRAGMKTVLTVHVPSVICLRGTMMRFGDKACDGLVDEFDCAACWGHSRGAPIAFARAVSRLPVASQALTRLIPGRVGTALGARGIALQRKSDLADGIEAADHVVAVCQWLHDALARNAAPADKLSMSRQGVSAKFMDQASRLGSVRLPAQDGVLRLLFLGRWHPVKGIDIVIRAMRELADLPVSLTIHALAGGEEEAQYQAEMEALANDDPRITIKPPLARAEIAQAMAQHDVLVVPSLWLETGPLVALEAQALGLPVLGSRMGGLVELVAEPGGGKLVAPGDVGAWREALRDLAEHPPARGPVAPSSLRTMDEAAAEMASLYRSLH